MTLTLSCSTHCSTLKRKILVKGCVMLAPLQAWDSWKLFTVIFHILAGIDTIAKTAHPSDSFNSSFTERCKVRGKSRIVRNKEGISILGNISGALVRFIVWLLAGKLFVSVV